MGKEVSTKIRGIIFDFNGTLFFDSDKHEYAWKKISQAFRSDPFSNEEMSTYVHGRTNRSILEYLFQHEISDDLLNDYVLIKENYYKQACLEDPVNMKLVNGAVELFEYLMAKNIRINIATAAEITNLNFFNKQFGLETWFDKNKIVYDDFNIRSKPAPDMFLKAADNIGVNPSNCLVFEDSESGIIAAKNAGISKIVIIDPSGDKSRFLNNPDVAQIITDFTKFDRSCLG